MNMKRFTPICLTFVAGFVDTATFVGAGGIFAAHVTGNFVVFGAALAKGIEPQDYAKLIAFPLFILGVGLGVLIYGLAVKHSWRLSGLSFVLGVQSLLLLAVGFLAYFYSELLSATWLALIAVVAMALQNSIHRYVPGPMTTVMTGTVMNWTAARAERLLNPKGPMAKDQVAKPMTGWMMLAFACGCVLSGFLTHHVGLVVCLVPGIAIAILSIFESHHT
jgi:uncharacterized membrane protein YoaK (UPF0700 family)